MSERARHARFVFSLCMTVLLAGAPFVARSEGSTEKSPADTPPAAADAATGSEAQTSGQPPAAGVAGAPPGADQPPEEQPQPPEPPSVPPPPELGNPEIVPPIEQAPAYKPAEPIRHLRTISINDAAGVLGKRVLGAAGEDVGMVVDVLIDNVGKPSAVVVDFGGFLGVGSRKIAVDWALLQFRPGDERTPILLDVTAEAIRAAPEYRPSDKETKVVIAPPAAEVPSQAGPAQAAPEEPSGAQGAPGTGEPEAPPNNKAPPEALDGGMSPEPHSSPPPVGPPANAPPLPTIKPPVDRPKANDPGEGLPPATDPGPPPAPSVPPMPPDARQ